MKRLAALSILATLSLGVLGHAFLVQAQTPAAPAVVNVATPIGTPELTPQPTASDSSGLSAADFNSQISALNTTYIDELTTYRSDEKAFQIAKDQYYQIQTLASLEDAVKQTRQVMLTRLEVIQTYLAISRLTLQNTKGIDTQVKATTLQQLDTLVSDLKTHQLTVSAATDRPSLLAAAVEFSTLSPRISDVSTRVSLLVSYGNLQTVDDKMVTIKQDMEQQFNQTETDPLQLAQKIRGLDEVQRNLDQVNAPLVKVRAELDPQNTQNGNLDSGNFSSDFSTIYGGLSRSLSYLQELVKN